MRAQDLVPGGHQ